MRRRLRAGARGPERAVDSYRVSLPAIGHLAGGAWAAAARHVARRRSVILCYHGVADSPHEEDQYRLQLPPAMFRAQLEMLRDAGFRFVTVAELAQIAGGGRLPPGLAAVSFDDGLRNNLTTALPILGQLGLRATVYVPTGWLGGQHPDIGSDAAILTGDEVRELVRHGWEIGGHTASHADLSLLDYVQCRAEIERSCTELARLTGAPIQTFAYPFGRYSAAAMAAVRDCGLLAAVAGESGSWQRFELKRTMVGGAEPLSVFLLKSADRYEPLLKSAPMRLLRSSKQAARRRIRASSGCAPD